MIYLIDDNQSNQQIEKFGINYIETNEFSDFLIVLNKIEKNSDLSFLNDATCILLHATTEDVVDGFFISGSISNTTKIIKDSSDNGDEIPLVLFSEKMNEIAVMTSDRYISSIKKSVFYLNLYDFLLYFQENNNIEFKILAFGKNYKSVEVARYVNVLTEKFIFRNQDDLLKISDINLKLFKELTETALSSIDFDDFITNLEDHPITIKKFIENLSLINQSFTQYGKNIYGWL